MTVTERDLRREVAAVSLALHAKGWVANHDGNITVLLGNQRVLGTPTALSKRRVEPADVLVLAPDGKVQSGTRKCFGEFGLHALVYEMRADVHAVVHAHPPHATALACAGSDLLDRPFLAEAVVSIGPRIPTVPVAAPGPAARQALAPFVSGFDAVLLGSHGVLAWGADLEQAFLRVELVEHLARIALLAAPLGGPRVLPDDMVSTLIAARRKAGLGAAAMATADWRSGAAIPGSPLSYASTPASSAAQSTPKQGSEALRRQVLDALRRPPS